jgi:hypothetical protein
MRSRRPAVELMPAPGFRTTDRRRGSTAVTEVSGGHAQARDRSSPARSKVLQDWSLSLDRAYFGSGLTFLFMPRMRGLIGETNKLQPRRADAERRTADGDLITVRLIYRTRPQGSS